MGGKTQEQLTEQYSGAIFNRPKLKTTYCHEISIINILEPAILFQQL